MILLGATVKFIWWSLQLEPINPNFDTNQTAGNLYMLAAKNDCYRVQAWPWLGDKVSRYARAGKHGKLKYLEGHGARPTKHISIESEIRWKFKTL